MQPYVLKGGLDLRTGKASANPGTLAECLNYEVGDQDGYTRIQGFDRFDGQFRTPDVRSVRLRGTLTEGSFTPGDEVELPGGARGYITSIVRTPAWSAYALCHSRETWPLAAGDLVNLTGEGTAAITAADLLPAPVGRQSVVNTARKALVDAARSLVSLVPGNPDTPVSGLFWLHNRLYAIRDYPLAWFESAKQWPFHVGDTVTMPGGVYTVVMVHYSSDAYLAGWMVLYPIDQDGNPMTTAPQPGDLISRPADYTGADGCGAALGELPAAFLGSLNYGDGKAVVTSPGQGVPAETDDLKVRAYRTPAALWKATDTGWERVDLKREAQFSTGTAAFGSFITANLGAGATPLATGYAAGALAVFNGDDVTSDVSDADDVDVDLSGEASDELRVTGFDFSAIPDTATIVGIEVRIKRHADSGGKVQDDTIELIGLDGTSSNKARMVAWDSSATEVVYGGAADTWGNDSITPDIIQSAQFGVRVVTKAIDATPSGGIDAVAINVHYRRRDAAVYVWTGTTDIAMSLVDVQLITGDYVDGNAAGWLVLDIPNSSWASQIANGMQIRSAPNGAGDLLATVASGDQAIRLPGWPDLQANRSQYRFVVTNYYGMDDYQAVYGVSGASPAFTFDGSRLLWVRTPLDPQSDLPRHVARHGSALVLGYYQGAYIVSAVGQPTNFRGEDGAASFEIGETLTNLLPAMGDALLVTGRNKTVILRGQTPDDYNETVVSGNRGALEYTGADIGRLLATDALGIAAADATQAFGDLSRTYLSMAVEAWLRPRLNSALGAESDAIRPVCAFAANRKNQYRLYFRDGYYLTMTANEPVEFTTQRYFRPAGTEDMPDQPYTLATICAGIDIDGRERIFGSFDADDNRGYVFELDHGNTFDGQPIPAHFTLNPLSFSAIQTMTLKQFDRLFLMGSAEGYARVTVSRTGSFDLPDGTRGYACSFGDPLAMSAPQARGARGVVDAPVEAYEMTIRIDSATDKEGPHAIQAIATEADDRGDSRGHVRG